MSTAPEAPMFRSLIPSWWNCLGKEQLCDDWPWRQDSWESLEELRWVVRWLYWTKSVVDSLSDCCLIKKNIKMCFCEGHKQQLQGSRHFSQASVCPSPVLRRTLLHRWWVFFQIFACVWAHVQERREALSCKAFFYVTNAIQSIILHTHCSLHGLSQRQTLPSLFCFYVIRWTIFPMNG